MTEPNVKKESLVPEAPNDSLVAPPTNKSKKSKLGETIVLVLLAIIAGGAAVVALMGPPPPPPPPPHKPVRFCESDLTTISDMSQIWRYDRTFSFVNKRLANSISEMGCGVGIGTSGYVLRDSIWNARYDQLESSRRPTLERDDNIPYYYRLVPLCDADRALIPNTAVIMALPKMEDDATFVAVCGPVELSNDFSFFQKWDVLKFEDQGLSQFLRDCDACSLQNLVMPADTNLWIEIKDAFNPNQAKFSPKGN